MQQPQEFMGLVLSEQKNQKHVRSLHIKDPENLASQLMSHCTRTLTLQSPSSILSRDFSPPTSPSASSSSSTNSTVVPKIGAPTNPPNSTGAFFVYTVGLFHRYIGELFRLSPFCVLPPFRPPLLSLSHLLFSSLFPPSGVGLRGFLKLCLTSLTQETLQNLFLRHNLPRLQTRSRLFGSSMKPNLY